MFAWLRHNESNHKSGTGNFRYCLYQIDWKRVMPFHKTECLLLVRLISYLNAIKTQMSPLTPTIGGSEGGGASQASFPPMGPNSFLFAYIFAEKCPCWRPTPLLKGPHPTYGKSWIRHCQLLHSYIIFPSILSKYFHIRLLLYVNLITPVRGKKTEHVYQI